MTRREYGQSCSVAGALDRIGERWSLLIVRELLLGPLRFSDLLRSVGGPPTDVLTKRLRDLEANGIVQRTELGPPASGVVYELTDLGRELDRILLELGRWGLHFYEAGDAAELEPSLLPNSLRVLLQPPAEAEITVQLHSENRSFRLDIAGGRVIATRGETSAPELTLSGPPRAILAAIALGEQFAAGVEVEGDRAVLEALREMVVLPERVRRDAEAAVEASAEAAIDSAANPRTA
ncbi:MAG: winged helix-turn-helix transcriptional regulator [Chloroflexota bacterium]